MTATVVILTLCATRQADVTNVLTVSRVENVTMTLMSATTTPVTNTPTAPTHSVPSSVSARPDTHSTTQPSVKVCSCKPAPMTCHGLWCAHRKQTLLIVFSAFSSIMFTEYVVLFKVFICRCSCNTNPLQAATARLHYLHTNVRSYLVEANKLCVHSSVSVVSCFSTGCHCYFSFS